VSLVEVEEYTENGVEVRRTADDQGVEWPTLTATTALDRRRSNTLANGEAPQ
jgi:hypothetical protein